MPTFTNNVTGNDNAIEGTSIDGRGIVGKSETNYGIRAHSKTLAGIGGLLTRVEEWKDGLPTARVLLGLIQTVTRFGAKLRALVSAFGNEQIRRRRSWKECEQSWPPRGKR